MTPNRREFAPLDEDFRQSSWCQSERKRTCVEVAAKRGKIIVRDSKNTKGTKLTFSTEEWEAFLEGVKRGQFEVK